MPSLPISARVLPPDQLPASLIGLWNQWCASSPHLASAFLSYDFIRASAAVLPHVRVAVLERDGQPCAFFPFQFASRLHAAAGWAQPCAFGLSDCFGLVAPPGFSIQPSRLLAAAGINYIYFDHLDEHQANFGLSAPARRPGTLIRLPDGPERYFAALTARDKEFVQDTGRRRRQLISQFGPLSLEPDNTPAALDRLIDHKRRQYSATAVADPLAAPSARAFLHSLLDTGSPLCRPMLVDLRAGSTWVASHFGLLSAGRLHYWFPVYNPELKRYAPGRLLLVAILEQAEAFGITLVDRGEGESMAKGDFANDHRSFFAGVWHRSNPASFAIRAVQAVQWRLAARRS